jgi:UDP-glucuronate decarboxylase
VVSNLILQALRNEPITLYGDGSQTRAFCYVDDMIDAFVRFMASAPSATGPLNLGNPVEIPVRELAERVLEIVGSRSPIVFRPLPQDDPRQRCPDIGRARELLDWEPLTPLDEGLERTVRYFEALLTEEG